MFDISSNNIITLTRGDSMTVPLFINCGDSVDVIQYILRGTDRIYFALTEPNQKFEDAVLKKVYDSSSKHTETQDILITLDPKDTENLLPGLYYYTIKLRRIVDESGEETEEVYTVVPQRQFNLI